VEDEGQLELEGFASSGGSHSRGNSKIFQLRRFIVGIMVWEDRGAIHHGQTNNSACGSPTFPQVMNERMIIIMISTSLST